MIFTLPLKDDMLTLVDRDMYEKYQWFTWHVSKAGYVMGRVERGGKLLLLHRLITDAPKGVEVDHKNGDTFDNRKKNLRLATRKQNAMNMAGHRNGTSRFKGVSWYNAIGRWIAQIYVDGKNVYLGQFKTEKEAAKAYNSAARRHFRQYARVN